MADTINWPGSNGHYPYWFLDNPNVASGIKKEPGNYMFVRLANDGWLPVYIGIADKDLSTRIPYHERWEEAVRLGATHVMSHTNHNSINRQAEEVDLIGYWQPPLNTQHRKPKTGLAGLGS